MLKLKRPIDERGVSVVLGAMLVIGIIIAVFATFINSWIPNERNRLAQEHALAVRDSFGELQTAIDGLDGGRSTVVDVQMNPGQVPFFGGVTEAGTLSTEPWAYRIRKQSFDDACLASTYVDNKQPDNNPDKDAEGNWVCVVQWYNETWWGFLKFDLRKIQSKIAENIGLPLSIRLQLALGGIIANPPAVEVYGVLDDSWSENLTWNDAQRLPLGPMLDNKIISRGLLWASWDVSSWVMEKYQEGTVSFCLKTTTLPSYAYFGGRRTYPPRLEFEFAYPSGDAAYVSGYDNKVGKIENFNAMMAEDDNWATLREENYISVDGSSFSMSGGSEITGYGNKLFTNVFSASPDTFGYTTAGSSWQDMNTTGDQYIYGSVFNCPSSGTVNFIKAYLSGSCQTKAIIYKHSDSSVLAVSSEVLVSGTGWFQFNFSSTSVVGGTDYVLCINGSAQDEGQLYIAYDAGDTNQGHYYNNPESYPNYEDPATFSHNNNKYSIYCTYTTALGQPILISPLGFIYENTPTFSWYPGMNAENHRLLVDDNSDFSSPIDNIMLGATDNSWTKPTPGYADGTYYWEVIAIKGNENASSSGLFVVTFGPPTLKAPTDGSLMVENTPRFEWIYGPRAENHRLLVDDNSDFSSPIDNIMLGATDNSWTKPTPGYADGTYYWEVIAIKGNENKESGVWTFSIGHYRYAMNIELTIKNAPLSGARLEMKYQRNNSNDYFRVMVYDWKEDNWPQYYRGDKLDSLDWKVWSYPLRSNEVAENGDVRIKIVNANPNAAGPTDLLVDYLRVRGPRPYGSIEFLEPNVTPAQTYIYEDGAVILVQGDKTLMISQPAMITASAANGNNIRVDVHHVIVTGLRKSTSEGGTRGIRIEAKSSMYIVQPSGGPNRSNVTITIQSDYKDVWMKYLKDMEQELNAKGFGASLDPNILTLTIMGKTGDNNDIYYYEKVTEIEVSFV